MQHDDDIAFQRAILANPADTTLKLVYADWLQDRSDPRAEYIRRQLEIRPWSESDAPSVEEACQELRVLAPRLDPKWVAFMNTFAQPFTPGGFTFGEQMGTRGTIWHFESQYQDANVWSGAFVADVTFLDGVDWGECDYNRGAARIGGFLCEMADSSASLTESGILKSLKLSGEFYSHENAIPERCYIRTDYESQRMLHYGDDEMYGRHGKLKRHVAKQKLWYITLVIEERSDSGDNYALCAVITVGRSRHGNRLVGAIAFPLRPR